MPFQDYILLDGKRYRSLARAWRPSVTNPRSGRIAMDGTHSATFASHSVAVFEGSLVAPLTAPSPNPENWGTLETLLASLTKPQLLSFTDHWGKVFMVLVQGRHDQNSLQNVWDAPGNKFYVPVVLTGKNV
jgi:hypothetical protein